MDWGTFFVLENSKVIEYLFLYEIETSSECLMFEMLEGKLWIVGFLEAIIAKMRDNPQKKNAWLFKDTRFMSPLGFFLI